MSTAQQAQAFLIMAVCGALLGMLYDALMILRRIRHAGAAATALADLSFGAACAAGIILTALYLQIEAFRWYVFAGTGAGMAIYMLFVGTIVRKVMNFVYRFVKKS